jgi:hypothetical protein
VLTGTKTERESALESEVENERTARKRVEQRNAQLEDENHQLKQIPKTTTPAPPAQPKGMWEEFFNH